MANNELNMGVYTPEFQLKTIGRHYSWRWVWQYMTGFPPHVHKRSSLITKCHQCGFLGWTMLFVKVPNTRFLYGKALFKFLLILALLFVFHVPVNLSILGSYKNDCDRLRPDGEDDYKIDSCGNLNLDRIPSAVIAVNPAALTEYEEEEDEDAPEQKDRENFTDDTNYCYFEGGASDYMNLKWFHCERKSPPIPCA